MAALGQLLLTAQQSKCVLAAASHVAMPLDPSVSAGGWLPGGTNACCLSLLKGSAQSHNAGHMRWTDQLERVFRVKVRQVRCMMALPKLELEQLSSQMHI